MPPSLEPEYEAKYLDIVPSAVRAAIRDAKPTHHHPSVRTRRRLFDFPDQRLHHRGMWLRVREHGDGATMTVKQRSGHGIAGIREIEVGVSNVDLTRDLLECIGFVQVAYQESDRESWQLGDCQVTLDQWPWLPPFVEIEGPSETAVRSTAATLGLAWAEAVFDSVDGVYELHYPGCRPAISRLDLTFDARPAELAERGDA